MVTLRVWSQVALGILHLHQQKKFKCMQTSFIQVSLQCNFHTFRYQVSIEPEQAENDIQGHRDPLEASITCTEDG